MVNTATFSARNTCSSGGVVQTCIDDLKNAHTVEIVADIPRKAFTAFIPVAYSEMSRCVTNILMNAIEATTTADPYSKVYLSVHMSSNTCEVVIKDHGKGFSEDVLNEVMAGTRLTTTPGGTGLGIISAKAIVERAKGDLKITSSPAGTVVRLLLPRSAPPSWFFNIANSSVKELAVLDDDTTVHDKIRRLFPEKEVFETSDETLFLNHMRAHPNALALVDFDFGGTRSGLDVLSEVENGVLVSGRLSFDRELRNSAVERGVHM